MTEPRREHTPPRRRPLAELRSLRRSAAESLWRSHRQPGAFLTKHFWVWLWNYLKVVFTSRETFPTYPAPTPAYPRPGVFPIPDSCTIAIAADWGTGTDSAYAVADAIRGLQPDVTVHLGDVYYSGTADEFQQYFMETGAWPRGKSATYTLNGNHEMYSGGSGYFRVALPGLGQRASYLCLENANWRIIGLDTGYYAKSFPFLELIVNFIKIHRATMRWLKTVVFADQTDRRPVILLSHHQWFSAFDSEYQRIGNQLGPYLDRVLLWFWGHEHRFAGYAPFGFGGRQVRARCIGHGGMPIELDGKIQHVDRPLVFTDERRATTVDGAAIGFCGFALLRLNDRELSVEYFDEQKRSLLTERWQLRPDGPSGTVTGGELLKPYRPLTDLVSST